MRHRKQSLTGPIVVAIVGLGMILMVFGIIASQKSKYETLEEMRQQQIEDRELLDSHVESWLEREDNNRIETRCPWWACDNSLDN